MTKVYARISVDYDYRGGIDLNWVLIIVVVVFIELIIRFFTRGMEDKKKREQLLAALWVVLGVVLAIVWFFAR